jgi:hypothetical protein
MKVTITLTGTAPLLMHNVRLANPLDPFARSMKEITGKRKKTDDDYEQLARLEFEAGLYFVAGSGPIVPGANVEKCIVEGARITKQGKQVERGLFIIDNENPLIYDGPRDVEGLWKAEVFTSIMAVKPQGRSTVMRTRPIFREWIVETTAEVDPGLLNIDSLRAITNDAGSMVGLGDYRPRYGRFVAEVEKV